MSFGRVIIKFNGPTGRRQCARVCFNWRHGAEFAQQVIAIGEADIGPSIIWILHNGLHEVIDTLVEIIRSATIPEITPFELKVLRFGIRNVPMGKSLQVLSIAADEYYDAGD